MASVDRLTSTAISLVEYPFIFRTEICKVSLSTASKVFQQSDWRHQEASDLWDETLYKRAFRVPKSVEELIFDAEQQELLNKAIAALPEIQRRRFLLYHKYDFNYRQIDHLLSNSKYIAIVGQECYMSVQFEKSARCNIDYDKAGV